MKKIFYVIAALIFTGCHFNNNSNEVVSSSADTTAFNRPLEVTKQQVMLVPEAQEAVANWLDYFIAENEVQNFQNYSVNDVMSNAGPIAEIMKNLRETVPDSLKVEPVESRLGVLYTKAKVLEQLIRKRDRKSEEIAETAKQIPAEFNNLKIQLNEIFLKTLEDFEEELDLYEVETDTLNPIPQAD